MATLKGDKLAEVVEEVLDEAAAAERAKHKAEVKYVVERITADMKREKQNQQDHLEAATKATERLKALQERMRMLKAGRPDALKEPELTHEQARHNMSMQAFEERADRYLYERAPYGPRSRPLWSGPIYRPYNW